VSALTGKSSEASFDWTATLSSGLNWCAATGMSETMRKALSVIEVA
jgi:hypothetical protein